MKRLVYALVLIPCIMYPYSGGNMYPMPDQTQNILALNPVVNTYNQQGVTHYGLDPVSVAWVYPELVMQNGDADVVNYVAFIPILISQVQQLQQANQYQRAVIEEQNRKIDALLAELQEN